MLAGFSQEALLHELFVAPCKALLPLADTQFIERPGWWQIVTPSLTKGGMNEVICSDFAGTDAAIDEALATYARLGLRFRFTLIPGAKMNEVVERLARRGLTRSEALGMVRTTEDLPGELPSDVTIEEVDGENVDAFTQVMAKGWEMDAAPLWTLHARMLADSPRRNWLFLARRAGVPAAVSSYVALERSGYLIGAVTLPEQRGQGIYRALVSARLAHARARGIHVVTTLARAHTSAPILTRLGFQTFCEIPIFLNF